MKYFFLIVLSFLIVPIIQAQTDFVILNDGSKVSGNVVFHSPLIGKNFLLLDDSVRFELIDIRAYRNTEGYFARISSNIYTTMFAKRVYEGKIDKFTRVQVSSKMVGYGGTNNLGPMWVLSHEEGGYFSQDGVLLKKITYDNLKPALKDNPLSMKYLGEYSTLKTWEYVLAVTGGALVLGGFLFAEDDKKLPVMSGVGLVIGLSAWISHLSKESKLMNALDAYNQN